MIQLHRSRASATLADGIKPVLSHPRQTRRVRSEYSADNELVKPNSEEWSTLTTCDENPATRDLAERAPPIAPAPNTDHAATATA